MTSTRSSRKQRTHSQFSRVFLWELRQGRILTFFYILGTLLILPGSVLMSILSRQSSYTNMTEWPGETAEMVRGYFANSVASDYSLALSSGMVTLFVLYALIYAGQSFHYMHARRSVDLFHSIPVRRKPLLLGKYFALLACLELPMALGAALSLLLCRLNDIPVEPLFFLSSFGDLALMAAACLTFAMLFMVISGTFTGAVISLTIVSLGWPILIGLMDSTMAMFLPGYVSVIPALIYTLFCPAGAAYQCFGGSVMGLLGFQVESYYSDIIAAKEGGISWFHVWWIVLTVALLLLSVFYYNRRQSEAAENYFSFPVIRGLLRGLVSIAAGLQTGLVVGVVLDSNLAYLVSIVAGAAVAHIVVQFVLTHSFQGFWKTVPAFFCAMVLTGGFLGILYTGGLGYVRRIPDPSQVERVNFSIPSLESDGSKESYFAQMSGLELYAKHDRYLTDLAPVLLKEEDFSVMEDFQRSVLDTRYPGPYLPFGSPLRYAGYYTLSLVYTLKDGGTLKREYSFPVFREDTQLLNALARVQKLDAIQSFCIASSATSAQVYSISEDITTNSYSYSASLDNLTADEQQQVWDTLTAELNSPSFRIDADLPYYEDWLLSAEQGDSSTNWGSSTSEVTEETDTSYYIGLDNIPFKDLSPDLQKLIETLFDPKEVDLDELHEDVGKSDPVIDSVSGYNIIVPECCTKTRQLIHDLTEKNGEWYYYNETDDFAEDE